MKAAQKDELLARKMEQRFGEVECTAEYFGDDIRIAHTLRRAEKVLHRWAEEECNGTIQREGDQGDGKPFRVWGQDSPSGKIYKAPTADREAGALRRIEKACKEAGLHYYHQTDPRGCALYVSTEPLTAQNYSQRGIACCD